PPPPIDVAWDTRFAWTLPYPHDRVRRRSSLPLDTPRRFHEHEPGRDKLKRILRESLGRTNLGRMGYGRRPRAHRADNSPGAVPSGTARSKANKSARSAHRTRAML